MIGLRSSKARAQKQAGPEIGGGGPHGARHVAIIMDGNGRWAKKRHLPRALGHKKGVEVVREIVRHAATTGLEALSLYAFSSENWKRPEAIDDALARTAHNTRTTLAVALNYGSQDELVRAAQAAAGEGAITAEAIEAHLDTAAMPPLDLLIRTSGEQRLSNFMLWQAAYAELWFTETLWPDFTPAEFDAALSEFGTRERRYGGR